MNLYIDLTSYTKYGIYIIYIGETIQKKVYFIGRSREDLKKFPDEVKQNIGYALFEAQCGLKPVCAKLLKSFAGGILEVVENFRGGTYLAVYTVKFQEVIYVLHCFQKKSPHGIKTSQQDIKLIKNRLRVAEENYKQKIKEGNKI